MAEEQGQEQEQEPTLPRMPALSRDAHSQIFGGGSSSRKRGRRDDNNTNAAELFSNSSDPAFFSSDDDPAIDNYVQGRRKKRYVGAWFAQQPASTDSAFDEDLPRRPKPKARRTLERQLDSGVWMGSDGTDLEDAAEVLPVPAQSSRLPELRPRQRRGFQRVSSLSVSSAEKVARHKIQECIEEGNEDVDLSTMGLNSLSNATIEPLSGFSCIPLVTKGVAFEQREPSLKLYLSSNSLSRLPGALFSLEHLTLLSLRGNGLTGLPPAVGKLVNLEVLNVSQNALTSLPHELLELISKSTRLKELLLHPNPYFQPLLEAPAEEPSSEAVEEVPHSPDSRVPQFCGSFAGSKQARSPVQYSDTTGRIYSTFKLAPSWPDWKFVETGDVLAASTPPSTIPYLSKSAASAGIRTATRVPTLLELALRACYQTTQLAQLPAMLPEDAPPHLPAQLRKALAQREMGGVACSLCKRALVVERTAWLEWWKFEHVSESKPLSMNPDEQLVPFLSRGCSWRCAP